jgi:EAL domain-containing protein (putative c-di-GMP-specific phosphodiesterase class I)
VFIPIAERLGLIDRIGMFALTRALADLARWRAHGPAPARISVNIAPSQLDDAFVADVAAALAQAGIEPSALTVEITESALPSDDAPVVLSDLADLGVSLDVDDFGTGYSSLVNLVRLPVHAVKVDRSLIWGLDGDPRLQTTVRAIIRLAHDLDMRCVVEGVETDAQRQWLTVEGCDLLQGFHLSKPVPADDVPALCAAALS